MKKEEDKQIHIFLSLSLSKISKYNVYIMIRKKFKMTKKTSNQDKSPQNEIIDTSIEKDDDECATNILEIKNNRFLQDYNLENEIKTTINKFKEILSRKSTNSLMDKDISYLKHNSKVIYKYNKTSINIYTLFKFSSMTT